MHERPLFRRAGIRHHIARLEIVGAVDDHVVARHENGSIVGRQPEIVQFHRDMGIDPGDRCFGALGLRRSDRIGGVDHLPLQIGQRDNIVVDDAKRADACGSEIFQHRRAEAAGADHQHSRPLQPLLAGAADLRQHDVAGIAFEFFVGEGGRGHCPTI
ncbi:hypothetical protein X764_11125 [Mesorhizobium sp. LSHC440A00]|nr:hypothetical protein X764_11125 [Mesorhizobium sp. LSHC440A00]